MIRLSHRALFVVLGAAFVAACSSNKVTPTTNPSASPGASSTPSSNVPGGGLAGSSNVAYVPEETNSAVELYSFASEAFTPVLINTSTTSEFASVRLSVDGKTLYALSQSSSAPSATLTAYALSSTGAAAEGTVTGPSSSVLLANEIVPQPNGNVIVYAEQSNSASYAVTTYSADLRTVVTPATTLTFAVGVNGYVWSAPDAGGGTQYIEDSNGDLDVAVGGSIVGSIGGLLTGASINNISVPTLVSTSAGSVYALSTVGSGSNSVALVSATTPSSPQIVQQIPIGPTPTVSSSISPLGIFYEASTKLIYAFTQQSGAVYLTTINPASNAVVSTVTINNGGVYGYPALSGDGSKLVMVSSPSTFSVYNTANGSAIGAPSLPAPPNSGTAFVDGNVVAF